MQIHIRQHVSHRNRLVHVLKNYFNVLHLIVVK
jgi:hypothetical protein